MMKIEPSAHANKYDGYFFLEFTVGGEIASLAKMFAALKQSKDEYIKEVFEDETDEAPTSYPSDDPKWIGYLNETALQYFGEASDAEEERIYNELWKLTAPMVRLYHPMFTRGQNWDFESMIDAIFNGDYTLDELRQLDENHAVLLYNPWAGPFGGTDCLVALIESFGHRVTYDLWHDGPHQRGEIGWDYALARALVAQNKGFVPNS